MLDGTPFKAWEQPADHRRTFYVARQHPQASDNNPGSEDQPWKTIGRAAAALEPGDRVIVKEGIYREWVRHYSIGCKGAGIWLPQTGSPIIANNLIGCCKGLPVRIGKPDARIIDIETQRKSSAKHNHVVGNVFYAFETRSPELPRDGENVSDFNVFVISSEAKPFNIATWRAKTGGETHSQTVTAFLEFSTVDWRLRGTIRTLESPRVPALTADFLGIARRGTTSDAGPFLHPSLKAEIALFTADRNILLVSYADLWNRQFGGTSQ